MSDTPENKFKYLEEIEADTLGEICNISMGSAATTLSLLLNNKVDITTPTIHEYDDITSLFDTKEEFVSVEIEYVEGIEGYAIFSLKSIDCSIIADLMMGGSGVVEEGTEIGDLQLSAVGEAMNQMIGSSSTSLASIFGHSVNISPPIVKLQKLESEELNLTKDEVFKVPVIAVSFNLIVGDLINSNMIQVMSLKSAKSQVDRLMSTMNQIAASEPEPVAAPAPQQAAPAPQPAPQPTPVAAAPAPAIHAEPITVQPVQFTSFDDSPQVHSEQTRNLDLLMDIKLKLTVELGRTDLPIKKVLELTKGSVIELNKIAGEPVDLYANGKQIAKGEVVVIEDNFGLRITSIVSPDNRLKNL